MNTPYFLFFVNVTSLYQTVRPLECKFGIKGRYFDFFMRSTKDFPGSYSRSDFKNLKLCIFNHDILHLQEIFTI